MPEVITLNEDHGRTGILWLQRVRDRTDLTNVCFLWVFVPSMIESFPLFLAEFESF